MKFNHNVRAFSPDDPYIADREEVAWEDIPKVSRRGEDFIYLSVTDNSMYDRYDKGDIVIAKVTNDPDETVTSDALVLLPDDSVCLKKIKINGKKIRIIDRNELDPKEEKYKRDDVKILAVPTSVMRS